MKLRFDPHLPHQHAAIDAVVGVFEGQPRTSVADALAAGREHAVLANRLSGTAADLERALHRVQRAAGLPVTVLGGGDPDEAHAQLSVEMETGTGKTYVYLRTALVLAERYGMRKFVIVVPSVAIREGVMATARSTREHFSAIFGGLAYRFFAYDGAKLGRLRSFARSSQVELMIVTLDAFNKARNRMRQPHDSFGGRSALSLLRAVRPVVIVDEPQRMESDKSRAALADLSPLVVLRYGATHRDHRALVHRLSPRQAHMQGLVKRIEVAAPAAGVVDRAARIAAQIEATVILHLRRQAELYARGIKVLSLLFLERVDDWRSEDGLVRAALARSLRAHADDHPRFAGKGLDTLCAAYFAEQRRGGRSRPIDSRTGRSAADERAYSLIMRDKERLLSFEEPTCFVISHSALREGWDNPNIFQICTLASSHSKIRKRQEVGRGVRLCVDDSGARVLDPDVDVLTVIANDSYEEYVGGLQAEAAEEGDARFHAPLPRRAGERRASSSDAAVRSPTRRWVSVDGERLRRDAVAIAQERAGTDVEGTVLPEVEDATRAVVNVLLARRPPQLVSTMTIDLVLRALGQAPYSWSQVDTAAVAIGQALARQGVDVDDDGDSDDASGPT